MPSPVGLSENALLLVSVLAAFLATTALVLGLTTPVETPAMRLKQYARYTGRRGSPGAEAEDFTLRERVLNPLVTRIIEFAARGAPSRARRTVAAELNMAGSRMNPTMFLGIRTIIGFGLPTVAVLKVLSAGTPQMFDWIILGLALVWGQRLLSMWLKRRIRARQ